MDWILHSKPWITEEDKKAITNVMDSGFIGAGSITKKFEKEFAEWVGSSLSGVAVSSGTAAVYLALKTIDVKKGDEIILPTYVCHNVLEAVITAGATPMLCDVGANWVVEPKNIDPLITKDTKAIIVPHMYGIFADVQEFKKFGLIIIEDCAQAIGDKSIDKINGDIAVFSFQPTKCLTSGEGGMLVSLDPDNIKKATVLRDGCEDNLVPRIFSPMSDINSALGLNQLRRYANFLDKRRKIAGQFLTDLAAIDQLLINYDAKASSMYFRLPIKAKGGLDKYQPLFAEKKIHVRKGVDKLLHRLMGIDDDKYPMATHLFNSTISLPIYPALADSEIDRCIQSLKLFEKQ